MTGTALTFTASLPPSRREVERTTDVGDKDETFVTQKAGKIIQTPVLPSEQPETHFRARHTLQSTLLLQKKREMQTVQAQLDKKRLEFAKRMEECREKQEELRAKQKQIRDRVTKFEKFLKENDAKRQRANAKTLSEKKLRELKESEYSTLLNMLRQEQTKHAHILRLIKRYQIYETYLQTVVNLLPPDYLDIPEPHINDILLRHKTLTETQSTLMDTLLATQDAIESHQNRLTDLVKEKNDWILVYNSTLGTLQKRLDERRLECAYVEQRLEERDNTGKERMRMLSETKLAINNIYDRVLVRAFPHHLHVTQVTNGQQQALSQQQQLQQQVTGTLQNAQAQQETEAVLAMQAARDAAMDNSAKALAERLHAIMDRVLDLQHIAQRAEQFLNQDRIEKSKRQAALAAAEA
ncbi:hypothetical protein DFS34DRAFT_213884 [Phlyctochytrium arcticum]|nr:hypothetical protein DFS34DRAFT_213884 [Phlyctochytrium arcticum]